MIDKTKELLAQANLGKTHNAREYSPLALAYIGDAVYEVMIRTVVIGMGNARVNQYHQTTKEFVQAKGQAQFYNHIKEILTEAEEDIFKRGRNAKSSSSAKNTDILTYRHATGVEALIGYLYLDQDIERILEIMKYGLEKLEEEKI
ncbi:MAG TPA: ribonuclease III [Epulopiscium sp.]|nr:ribonuclease III [Candidatus Epulonipiscium sp.]